MVFDVIGGEISGSLGRETFFSLPFGRCPRYPLPNHRVFRPDNSGRASIFVRNPDRTRFLAAGSGTPGSP